ncbi:hypothetical protein ACF1BK_25480 [Streptomyces globisporus]|uniref:hypothetical protein n=1 Tax=Streptomyces globisporus TaxID=1908 RepID=UPI0036F811F7
MILRARGMMVTGAVAAVTVVAGLSALAVAAPQTVPGAARQPADGEPPSVVEDFTYPGAERILQEQGIELRKGNGRILLADCAVAKDIQVTTSVRHPGQTEPGKYCFQVSGPGYLTMEVPKVFNILTGDVAVQAKLTADGKTQSVDVAKNDIVGVGAGANPPGAPTVLVELRVSG